MEFLGCSNSELKPHISVSVSQLSLVRQSSDCYQEGGCQAVMNTSYFLILEVGVGQLLKGGNYSFLNFEIVGKSNSCRK